MLLTQLEISLQTTVAALKIGQAAGVTTILNPAPAQALPDEIYQYADIICPNETELETLTGLPVKNVDDATNAARVLIKRGAKSVVVTLGENGSLYVTPTAATHVPVSTRVVAVDTTGAGDCFLGSFAYFLASGASVEESMKRANTVAGTSVTRPGTQSSYPSRAELPAEWF